MVTERAGGVGEEGRETRVEGVGGTCVGFGITYYMLQITYYILVFEQERVGCV